MKQKGIVFFILSVFITCTIKSFSQQKQVNQPYSFLYFHKNLKYIYQDTAFQHSSLKPFNQPIADAELSVQKSDSSANWLFRKVFQEHLINVVKEDHVFYFDLMPDFLLGKQLGTTNKTLWTNSRGFQLGLNILDKFNLFVDFYENQAKYPSHIDSITYKIGALPGQGFSKTPKNGKYDWMNTTVNLSYNISSNFHFNLAYDRIHLGEGYRSILLSNNPYNYSFAKVSSEIGKWQFNTMWAYLLDRKHPRQSVEDEATERRFSDGIKYAAFQYVDYAFSSKFSAGFFHSLIWADERDSSLFTVNGGLGLNVKYNPWSNIVLYGQAYSDDLSKFSLSNVKDRRTAYQIGGHLYEVFGVECFNLTVEYNQAAPNTYNHENNRISYTSNAEYFSHPRGADYREVLGIASYQWQRWSVFAQTLFSNYGGLKGLLQDENPETLNNKPFFKIAGVEKNRLFYNELNLSYLINPKYNLRLDFGLINRTNKEFITNTVANNTMVTFGLRSSFRRFQTEY